MHEDQISLSFENEYEPNTKWLQIHHLIIDRGSKYSVTIGKVQSKEEAKAFLLKLKEDKKYRKATHNSFAFRIKQDIGIHDQKSDDGETGAGMVILRLLHKNTMINTMVVVTRWYGGVKLFNDRFKHIVDATQEAIDKSKS